MQNFGAKLGDWPSTKTKINSQKWLCIVLKTAFCKLIRKLKIRVMMIFLLLDLDGTVSLSACMVSHLQNYSIKRNKRKRAKMFYSSKVSSISSKVLTLPQALT